MSGKVVLNAVFIGLLAAASTGAEAAGGFPSRPITIVVGSEAGSSPDVLARIVATDMGQALKQSIIVENKPGATGAIGAGYVASAHPDGYTLLMGTVSNIALSPLSRTVRYRSQDFTTVGAVASVPLVLVTGPGTHVRSLSDLKALAAKQPQGMVFSSPGIGGPQHLAGILLQKELGLDLLHVPYKSGGAAVLAVASGETQMTFAGVSAAMPLIHSKKVVPVFITSETRLKSLPEVPTSKEFGAPGLLVDNWHGLFAPKGLPDPLRKILTDALHKALENPQVQGKFVGLGAHVDLRSAEEYTRFVQEETQRWARVVHENNITF
ncbi:tripartite tricarboxylate transporter substrate binding protein [Paralcaligenes sp. KSB-10]|uniref:Bug family tripartite tricarboxylate transporter substrate binding protein n=1 Tax=Paralcaligenes sp. KSB-10 TaxID=2901142 RepID=UPI001E2BFE10|nr:tripartite tricarboxylate transporter substrate binding protein [Paralcaligenes sp. KSB-10]UHL63207.1 tripartite tricarboxylate transporter substrate binding protein [Paralcaligenes sp. KSB-10]